jgi:DNA-binding LytR/AlgR family response regulator
MEIIITLKVTITSKERELLSHKLNKIWNRNKLRRLEKQVKIFFKDSAESKSFKDTNNHLVSTIHMVFIDTFSLSEFSDDKEVVPGSLVFFLYRNKFDLSPLALSLADGFMKRPFEEEEVEECFFQVCRKYKERQRGFRLQETNRLTFNRIGLNQPLIIKELDILFIEADSNLAKICFLTEDKEVQIKKIDNSISECEQMLDKDYFFRVHRKYIVNKARVQQQKKEKTDLNLILTNQVSIPIARRRKKMFWEWYEQSDDEC